MRDLELKVKLKDHEFRDYKFKSKASKRIRKRIRKFMKRTKHKVRYFESH